MATTQSAADSQPIVQQGFMNSNTSSPPECITISPEHISVSQLLGRDYVFIDTRANNLLLTTPQQISAVLEHLVMQLVLTDSHTLFVAVSENEPEEMKFIRHETGWHNRRIVKLESIPISCQEQQDFMMMIWQCSTPLAE